MRFPQWQPVYHATLEETDLCKLGTLVEITEATILTRRDDLKETPQDRSEREAIQDALRMIATIKKERFGFDVVSY